MLLSPSPSPSATATDAEDAPSRSLVETWQASTPTTFNPSADDLVFLRAATGIQDEAELKAHVLAVQQRALQVFPYPCIYKFSFASTSISKLSGFKRTIQLAKERPGALLLDIGCCFGADVRMAVLEGFPPEQIVASDLHGEFWDLGHELFRDSRETLPVTFLAGDVFDQAFLSPLPACTVPSRTPLPELLSLTPLHRRLSSIHASLFFHLFSRSQQSALARLLASLLLLQKGTVVFGHQIAAEQEGLGEEKGKWAHNAASWKELWEGALKDAGWKGGVEVKAKMVQASEWVRSIGIGTHTMFWTVELV